MSLRNIIYSVLLFVPLLSAQQREIVAYYTEWGVKSNNPYYVKDIEERGSADKITVLNYAFIIPQLDSTGHIVPGFMDPFLAYQQIYSSDMSIDGNADDSSDVLRGQFNQLKKLKKRYPDLKILLSLGGWDGSKYFSDAARTPESREFFVNECIRRFITGDLPEIQGAGGEKAAAGIFDGFDIDWEYPAEGGPDGTHHHPADSDNLSSMIALFRTKLDSISPGFILTAAIPATERYLNYYNLYHDQRFIDWFNVMTYDYMGNWDSHTGHMAALLSSPADTILGRERNSFDKSIKLLNCIYGVSSSKLAPAVAFYGRGWQGVDSINMGLAMEGSGISGDSVQTIQSFSTLENMIGSNFHLYWDSFSMAPYLYSSKDKIFWTFDNEKSIALKTHYVNAYKLRGISFWEISGDDSAGTLVDVLYRGNMPDIKVPGRQQKSFVSIEIVKPEESDWINEGSNVIIDTKSSDNGGRILKVEFFCDGKSLGYTTEKPFNWVWFNVPKGSHRITTQATDSNGAIIESTPVYIDVKDR